MIEMDMSDPAVLGIVPKADKNRPRLAVCSSNGFEVDLHLGQTGQFLIYGPNERTGGAPGSQAGAGTGIG